MFWDKHSFPSHHHKRALWAHEELMSFVSVWFSLKTLVFLLGAVSLKITRMLSTYSSLLTSLTEGKIVWRPQAAARGAAKILRCYICIQSWKMGSHPNLLQPVNMVVGQIWKLFKKWRKMDFSSNDTHTHKGKHTHHLHYYSNTLKPFYMPSSEHGSI